MRLRLFAECTYFSTSPAGVLLGQFRSPDRVLLRPHGRPQTGSNLCTFAAVKRPYTSGANTRLPAGCMPCCVCPADGQLGSIITSRFQFYSIERTYT